MHAQTHIFAHTLTPTRVPIPLSLSHQTAGCLNRRNQCLLVSLDWAPPLPRDSSVMIGPTRTNEHRHVGIQEDTDSSYTNKQPQDRSMQQHYLYCQLEKSTCLLLWVDISTCSRPKGLRAHQTHRKHSPSHTGPAWGSQPLRSPGCCNKKVTTRLDMSQIFQHHNNRENTFPPFPVHYIRLDSPQVGATTHSAHEETSLTLHHLLRA